jgi:hypothetical protein
MAPQPNQLTATLVRAAGALLCFSAMMICNLWAVIIGLDRIEQVNKRMPEDKQFEAIGWGPFKRLRFEEEYERFFPDGALRRKERILFFVGTLSAVGLFICVAAFL